MLAARDVLLRGALHTRRHWRLERVRQVCCDRLRPPGDDRLAALLYSGEQYDSNLKMYNLRARFYDPDNGRFSAIDSAPGSVTGRFKTSHLWAVQNQPL